MDFIELDNIYWILYLKLGQISSSNTISTNATYIYFETACKESAAKIIYLKQKLKKRTPCESDDICKKNSNHYM